MDITNLRQLNIMEVEIERYIKDVTSKKSAENSDYC